MAKPVLVKCPLCKETEDKTKMVTHARYPKRYLHQACLDKELPRLDFLEKEKIEKDKLWETICRIYGITTDIVPVQCYAMMENLRNGNPIFRGKAVTRSYKDGFEWSVINQTFIDCEDKIKWSISQKDFQTTSSMLRYGFKIVVDKVLFTKKKMEREKRVADLKEARRIAREKEELDQERLNMDFAEKQATPKRSKNDTVDISRFLD